MSELGGGAGDPSVPAVPTFVLGPNELGNGLHFDEKGAAYIDWSLVDPPDLGWVGEPKGLMQDAQFIGEVLSARPELLKVLIYADHYVKLTLYGDGIEEVIAALYRNDKRREARQCRHRMRLTLEFTDEQIADYRRYVEIASATFEGEVYPLPRIKDVMYHAGQEMQTAMWDRVNDVLAGEPGRYD